MPEEIWMEIYNIVQEAVTKTNPKEKKCKKVKWLSEEALQIAEERRSKKQGKGVRYTQLNAEFQSTQTHVHGVDDATQPSHPLSSPFPPTFNLS